MMRNEVIAVFAALIVSVGAAAQSNKVISANNYLRNGEYDKAMENIEEAAQHEKTSDRGKTWMLRGQVYLEIATSEEPEVRALVEDPLEKAAESFEKALDIGDRRVDEREVKQLYQATGIAFFQQALDRYNSSEFTGASQSFEKSAEIKEFFDIIDTSAVFNAGLAAEYGGDTARALKFYKKTAEFGYRGGDIYASMAQLYSETGDTENALEILNEGRAKYPEDQALITALIRIYLKQGKSDEALEMIDESLKGNPDNAQLLFAKGALYDEKGDSEKAMAAYQKAVQVDPENYESYYNLGAIFVNQASDIQTEMNELDFNQQEKYVELKKERNELFKKAIEPLEKAHKLNPEDLTTIQTLAQIYAQLDMTDKYGEMKSKMEALTE